MAEIKQPAANSVAKTKKKKNKHKKKKSSESKWANVESLPSRVCLMCDNKKAAYEFRNHNIPFEDEWADAPQGRQLDDLKVCNVHRYAMMIC